MIPVTLFGIVLLMIGVARADENMFMAGAILTGTSVYWGTGAPEPLPDANTDLRLVYKDSSPPELAYLKRLRGEERKPSQPPPKPKDAIRAYYDGDTFYLHDGDTWQPELLYPLDLSQIHYGPPPQ